MASGRSHPRAVAKYIYGEDSVKHDGPAGRAAARKAYLWLAERFTLPALRQSREERLDAIKVKVEEKVAENGNYLEDKIDACKPDAPEADLRDIVPKSSTQSQVRQEQLLLRLKKATKVGLKTLRGLGEIDDNDDTVHVDPEDQYPIVDGCLCRAVQTDAGVRNTKLSNFNATITDAIIDGRRRREDQGLPRRGDDRQRDCTASGAHPGCRLRGHEVGWERVALQQQSWSPGEAPRMPSGPPSRSDIRQVPGSARIRPHRLAEGGRFVALPAWREPSRRFRCNRRADREASRVHLRRHGGNDCRPTGSDTSVLQAHGGSTGRSEHAAVLPDSRRSSCKPAPAEVLDVAHW